MKLPADPKDLQPWHVLWAKFGYINNCNRFESIKTNFRALVELCRGTDLPDDMMQDLEDLLFRLKDR